MTRGGWAFIASVAVHAILLLVPLPRQSEPASRHLLLVDLIAGIEEPVRVAPAKPPGRPAPESRPPDAVAAGEAVVSPRSTTRETRLSEGPSPRAPVILGDGEAVEEARAVPEGITPVAEERPLAREFAASTEEPPARPPLASRDATVPESDSAMLGEPGFVAGSTIEAAEPASDPLPVIRERIMAAADYPLLARKRGWQGTTRVRFLIDDAGFPRTLELLQSSGHTVLDRASIRAVEEGAPYPGVEGWVSVPVVFRLEG